MSNEIASKIYAMQVRSHGGSGNIKADDVNYDHVGNPRKAAPFSIIDHKNVGRGKVDKRSFYDDKGFLYLEIHSTNHGNFKRHRFGKNGEHAHDIYWIDDESQHREGRELTDIERKDNGDIL